MSSSPLALALPVDGRQSPTALAVARGATRLLHALGFSVLSELPLASGRRAARAVGVPLVALTAGLDWTPDWRAAISVGSPRRMALQPSRWASVGGNTPSGPKKRCSHQRCRMG